MPLTKSPDRVPLFTTRIKESRWFIYLDYYASKYLKLVLLTKCPPFRLSHKFAFLTGPSRVRLLDKSVFAPSVPCSPAIGQTSAHDSCRDAELRLCRRTTRSCLPDYTVPSPIPAPGSFFRCLFTMVLNSARSVSMLYHRDRRKRQDSDIRS